MNYLVKKHLFILTAILALAVSSCKRDIENTSWDVAVVVPLMKSSLTIGNILPDSLLETNSDSSLSLVYTSTFYKANVDSLFQYPDTEMVYVAKLDSLVLGNQSFDTTLTIVDIATMADPTLGALLPFLNGTYYIIPPIDTISSGPIPIDASQYFETMTLISGYIDVIINNDLPIDVTDVVFALRNATDNTIIVNDSFDIIYAHTSDTITVDLAGKTIDGDLIAELVKLSSPGSNGLPVLIDTSDAVSILILMRDLKPSSATAIFPTQTIINQVDYLDMKDISQQLTYIKVKSGTILIAAVNTLQEPLNFTYKISSATLNGDTFIVNSVVPAAPIGGSSSFLEEYDFAGYELDLTIGATMDTVNTLKQEITGSIDSSGKVVTITLQDSFYVHCGLLDIIPEYAYGYMGGDTLNFGPSITTTDIFKGVVGGTLDFEDVNLSLVVNNGIGANASVTFNELTSINSQTINSVTLQGAAVAQPFIINQATDNPLTPTISELVLNNATTNGTASQFIENMPDQIGYSIQLIMNPGETPPVLPATGNDFIYYDSGLETSMRLEIPLSLIANDLTLVDTLDFDLQQSNQSNRIKDGTLNLIVENGFPFEAEIQLYMLNEDMQTIDSLFSLTTVSAATLGSDLIVSGTKKSKLLIPVSQGKVNTLYNTKYMLIRVAFSTASSTQHVKIYNDYSFDVQLVGDFNYTFEKN